MIMNWHRLFGLFLIDVFTDSPFEVELEKDLSLKQQFLDVVILRKQQKGEVKNLPDGLENLKTHNLLSYKSLHEPFDDWALKELIAHYVNYRKQISPSFDKLLPEQQFQLYGVSTRFPRKLAKQIDFQPINPGVYDVIWGTDNVRIIVLSEISSTEYNAMWRFFSAKPKAIIQARQQYRPHLSNMSSVINQLFEYYQKEKIIMSYTMQDFQKDYIRDHLDLLSPDEILQRYSPDEILQRYSPDEVLQRYSPDEVLQRYSPDEVLQRYSSNERLKGLSFEERIKGLSFDEIFKHFSPEEIKAWLEKQEKKVSNN